LKWKEEKKQFKEDKHKISSCYQRVINCDELIVSWLF